MKKIYPSIITLAIIAGLGVASSVEAAQNQENREDGRQQRQFDNREENREERGSMGTSTPDGVRRPEGQMSSTSPRMGRPEENEPKHREATSTYATTTGFFGKVGHFFSNLFGEKENNRGEDRASEQGMENRNMGLIGKITGISGETITMNSKFGTSTKEAEFTVDASDAQIMIDHATSTISSLAVDDMILVSGKIDGTSVEAKIIRKGDFKKDQIGPAPEATSTTSTSPERLNDDQRNSNNQNPGFFRKIGNFFSNIF